MQRQTLLSVLLIFGFITAFAQDIRSYDGSFNNLTNTDWGTVHSNLDRVTDVAYADGISEPSGITRPNPRTISNDLFSQTGLLNDPRSLSSYIWTWGQFIDHDIDLTDDDPTELAMIQVPMGDPWFDTNNTGSVMIPMKRSEFDAATGTSTANPRQHPNRISTFIDASNVYGSDQTTADWLRTFSGGKLKTSLGNLLPFNTTTSDLQGPIDSNAPHMADAVGASPKLYVAGDIRANENLLLTSFHTLFVREHNRLCVELAADNPTWSDEELYQHARKMVGGFLQAICYEEWLPTMGIEIPAYTGYDTSVNPAIMNIFSGAAFRMHSLINGEILRMDNNGNTINQGNISLKDAFFNPTELINGGGIDPLFKGMATVITQNFDSKLVDDLRNFLFGAPGAGGLDLAAINIQRGRERGFPDYNTVRTNFGLSAFTAFDQICSDPAVVSILEDIYNNDINNIDPFVGFLAEDQMSGMMVGETMNAIIGEQFKRLRDGDRFYYENDPVLTAAEKSEIKNTRLVEIIMRNTNIDLMQGNLFSAMDHTTLATCDAAAPNVSIVGNVQSAGGSLLSDVDLTFVTANASNLVPNTNTGASGLFNFINVPSCYDYEIVPEKEGAYDNGVTTFDIVKVLEHILLTDLLSSPFSIIAADVNNDGNVTTFDIVEMRQLILGIIPTFPNSKSWRFVESSYSFNNPLNPLAENFPDTYLVNSIDNNTSVGFIGIKVGDVNGNASTNLSGDADTRNDFADILRFIVEDRAVVAGKEYTVDFKTSDLPEIISYQFTLNFDQEVLAFKNVDAKHLRGLSEGNFGIFEEDGIITTSWNLPSGESDNELRKEDIVFSITFEAKASGQLRDLLSITSRKTPKEAYNDQTEKVDIALQFNGVNGPIVIAEKFEVYQNQPNPFKEATSFGFNMPQKGDVSITITDVSGRTLKIINQEYPQGYNQVDLIRKDFDASGVLYYEVKSEFGSASKKMVVIE